MGKRDREFNREAEELVREGNIQEILKRFTLKRMSQAGNSTLEFLNCVAILGVIGGKRPSYLEHHIIREWGSCPAVAWDL